MPPGISPVAKSAHSKPDPLSRSFDSSYRAAAIGYSMYMTESAGFPTDQPLLDSLILSTSFERTYRSATRGQTRSMTPLADLPTDQPLRDSLKVPGLSWSNAVMASYPSACVRDGAALRLIYARNATGSRLFSLYTAARLAHLSVIVF
jgi:hypothetical protein